MHVAPNVPNVPSSTCIVGVDVPSMPPSSLETCHGI